MPASPSPRCRVGTNTEAGEPISVQGVAVPSLSGRNHYHVILFVPKGHVAVPSLSGRNFIGQVNAFLSNPSPSPRCRVGTTCLNFLKVVNINVAVPSLSGRNASKTTLKPLKPLCRRPLVVGSKRLRLCSKRQPKRSRRPLVVGSEHQNFLTQPANNRLSPSPNCRVGTCPAFRDHAISILSPSPNCRVGTNSRRMATTRKLVVAVPSLSGRNASKTTLKPLKPLCRRPLVVGSEPLAMVSPLRSGKRSPSPRCRVGTKHCAALTNLQHCRRPLVVGSEPTLGLPRSRCSCVAVPSLSGQNLAKSPNMGVCGPPLGRLRRCWRVAVPSLSGRNQRSKRRRPSAEKSPSPRCRVGTSVGDVVAVEIHESPSPRCRVGTMKLI